MILKYKIYAENVEIKENQRETTLDEDRNAALLTQNKFSIRKSFIEEDRQNRIHHLLRNNTWKQKEGGNLEDKV